MAKVKYMGSSDVVTLEKGEDFAGRLADGLSKEVVWDKSNNWVVDTEEAGLSSDAVDLLLEDKERFKDVSNLSRVPTNLNQQIFGGLPKSVEADQEPAQAQAGRSSGSAPDPAPQGSLDAPAGGAGAAPVGGSTRTSRGGSTGT